MSRRLRRPLSGRRDNQRTLQARGGAVKQARTVSSVPPYWKHNKVKRWHQIATQGRVFSMMIAEVLFVGRWQTAHSFSPSQPAHAEVRDEMANL